MEALTLILLTFNEEKNLPALLESLKGVNAPVFAVDSYSTDSTLRLLEARSIPFLQHPFENYARQRNWAQANNPFHTPWVFHLDAGERLTPELVQWLNQQFDPEAAPDGYMFSRRTLFMGRWIRYGGHYPNYHLRLYRQDKGRCEDKAYDQHFVVDGPTQTLPPGIDIIDTVTDTLKNFTESHARWALFEAIETVARTQETGEVKASLWGTPIERRRWLKSRVFQRAPLFLRAFLYFFYRFFLKGGFRDGKEGLVFHVLQGFWFRFLVDANVLEVRQKMQNAPPGTNLKTVVAHEYGDRFTKAIGPAGPQDRQEH